MSILSKNRHGGKITKRLAEHKIDISRIQETHLNTKEMVEINDCDIYFCHGGGQEQNNNEQHHNIKGVAIAIRKIYAENIYQIDRIR